MTVVSSVGLVHVLPFSRRRCDCFPRHPDVLGNVIDDVITTRKALGDVTSEAVEFDDVIGNFFTRGRRVVMSDSLKFRHAVDDLIPNRKRRDDVTSDPDAPSPVIDDVTPRQRSSRLRPARPLDPAPAGRRGPVRGRFGGPGAGQGGGEGRGVREGQVAAGQEVAVSAEDEGQPGPA